METPKLSLKRNYLCISQTDDNKDETLQFASKQVKLSFNHDYSSENLMMDDDDERVVILLDGRVSSLMLEVKMQCTSFHICKFVELNEIFNTIGHNLIKDTIIQQAIVRITGKYTLSKQAINDYNNNTIPIPNSVMNIIGNNVEIMKNLIVFLNERIIDQCGYLIQNNASFLCNILKRINDASRELLTLPLMETETAIKLLDMNRSLFRVLPLRFRKEKQVALLVIRNEISDIKLIDKELLLDKDISYELAKNGLYMFIDVSDERNYLLAKVKYHHTFQETDFEIIKQKYNSDKEISMLTIKFRPSCYHYLSDELKHDIDIMLEVVKYELQLITKYDYYSLLLKDKEFILKAIKINPHIFKYASDELRGDMDVIMKLFESCKYCNDYSSNYYQKDLFQFASNELRNNKEIVMKAIEQSSNSYSYISNQLQHDRDVILKTMEKGKIPFLNNYLSDKEIMKKAIVIQPSICKFLPNSSCELFNDREFILDLVTNCGSAFEFVSDEFKNDKEIAMKAILSELESFKYISNELKNDREFNLKLCCVKANTVGENIFDHIADVFKNDYDFLFHVFKDRNQPLNIENLPYKVRNDKTLMLNALKLGSQYIECISDELKKDLSFIKEYISIFSDSLTYNLCRSWLSDKMIMIEILKINPKYFCLISVMTTMNLITDRDILAEALKYSENIRHTLPDETPNISKILNKEMVLNGLRCNENRFYLHASDEIKNDREVITQYLKSGGYFEKSSIDNLQIWKDDFEIMNLVIEMDACLIFQIGSKFIENEDFVFKAFTFNSYSIGTAFENGYKFSKSLVNRIFEYFKGTTFNEVKELFLLIDDKQVVLEQVRKYPNLVDYSQFRNDKELIIEACKTNYKIFEHLSKLKSDKEFILECSKYGPVMKYVTSTTLRSDFEFMKMACKINIKNILHYNGSHDKKLEMVKECWCEYVHNSLSPNKFIKYGKYLCEHSIQF